MFLKIKNMINGENSFKGASVILIITLFLSNLLGVFRDHFLAQKIPTSLLDTYYAAFRLPDLIFNLLILGAISSAFIPVFTSYISQKKDKEAWQIVNAFLNLAIVGLIITSLVLLFLLPYLIPLLVPKFDPEKQELTLRLSKILLLSPILFGISYIFSGILNSFKRFLVYSLAPLIYNLSIIFATIFLTDKYSVFGVAFGVIVGAFLHMLIQLPSVYNVGFRFRFVWDLANQGVRRITKLMLPRTIGLGSQQILLIVYTAIASTLGGGAVSIFNLADNIQTMPIVVFGTSFATAVFPTLSETASLQNQDRFCFYFNRTLKMIIFLLIPLSVGIILLRTQIVRLILGSGHFGWEQTILTAQTLGYFAISLVAQGLLPLLARAFYALQNTKTPMYIGIISSLFAIILAYILSKKLGVPALALAFSLGSFLNAILLYIFLRKKIDISKEKENLFFLIKVIFISAIMAIFIQIIKYNIAPMVDMHRFWGILVQITASSIVGVIVYYILAWLFKLDEAKLK